MAGNNNKSPAREIAEQYAAKHTALASKTLARLLLRDHPKMFHDMEHARGMVREIRGNRGKFHRERTADKSLFREAGQAGTTVAIPPAIKQSKVSLKITGPRKMLILGDIHAPFHEPKAIQAAVEHGLKEQCDSLYLNGDICDFYAISRFQKNPELRDMVGEIETVRSLLEELARHFKDKWFKSGNHEDRWNHYFWNGAPDFVGLDEFNLESILRLEEYGYQSVLSKQLAKPGKLNLLHGHELIKGNSPVNAARGLWLKLNESAACNHWHKTSQHSETRAISKENLSCWSIGCLCELNPEYNPLSTWNWGFAIQEIDAKGNFQFHNYKINHANYEVWRS